MTSKGQSSAEVSRQTVGPIRLSKASVGIEELTAVKGVFDACFFGMGSTVLEFENRLRDYFAAPFAIAVNSGTAALHLAIESMGIGPGDEVLVPSLTFVASFQAISATRAIPVACDVDPVSLLLDPEDVRRRLTSRTKAIMPVHYAGNPCAMDDIRAISQENGLRIVEDAAHAFGSTYKGRKIGSFGDAVCFSFDGVKTITTGEGGVVLCFEESFAEIIRQKRLLGIDRDTEHRYRNTRTWDFSVNTQGYRYHMSNINAAMGLAQFDKLDAFVRRRREISRRYTSGLAGTPGVQLLEMDYDEVVPHIFVIRLKQRRDELVAHLKKCGVETGIHYTPNHLHPLYRRDGVLLPVTEQAYKQVLTLPLHVDLTDSEVEYVIGCVRNYLE